MASSNAPKGKADEPEKGQKQDKEKDKKPDKAKEDKKSSQPSPYVQIPAIRIPVIQHRKIVSYFILDLVLEAKSIEVTPHLEAQVPRITSAIIMDLYGLLSVIWSPDYRIQAPDIKARVEALCRQYIKGDLLKNVLIEQFNEALAKN
ncbi:MAG: hypothetical protein ACK5O7_02860 [Holosporales bacterium]